MSLSHAPPKLSPMTTQTLAARDPDLVLAERMGQVVGVLVILILALVVLKKLGLFRSKR